MNPLNERLRRGLIGRCLDRVHQYAKERHKAPAELVGCLLPVLRMRNGLVMKVEGKFPEPDMFPPIEGEDDDDFDDDDEEFWGDEE